MSVESVHVDPAETGLQALSALTHGDILGTCYCRVAEALVFGAKSNKPALGQAVIW